MSKSNKLIIAMVMVFLAVMVLNPDLAAGKGGSKKPQAQNYLGLSITGQTTSYATGDDGDLQKGVPWPDPRFTDNGDGTVTDNLTGLMWMKDANCIATHYSDFDNDEIA